MKYEYSADKTLWSLNNTPTTGDGWQCHGSGTGQLRVQSCSALPTARGHSASVRSDGKQNSSALPGDLLQTQRWLFTVDTTLEGSQTPPHNNRLLFLTFTLSSCSHRSQISHISCRVLACLSSAAKFKACYHSLVLIQRYMEPQEK